MKGRFAITVATVLVAGAIAGWVIARHSPGSSIGEVARVADRRQVRAIEARLSGGFSYRPFVGETRGNGNQSAGGSDPFVTIGRLVDETTRNATPSNLHALGVAYAVAGDMSRAQETLERALIVATKQADLNRAIEVSTDVDLLVDVAAAQVTPQKTSHPFGVLLTAFSAADRATRLDSRRPEALFDRALTLEKLGLQDDAANAWRDYLRRDGGSGWAAEARRKLAGAERRSEWSRESAALVSERLPGAVMADSQAARREVEEELLPAWARLTLTTKANGTRALDTSRRIGTLLSRITNDFMAADEIAVIDATKDKARLARAQIAYADAIAAYRAQPADAVRSAFLQAAGELERARSPLAFRSRMYAATVLHYMGRNDAVVAEIDDILQRLGADATRYPSVVGQLQWVAGLALSSQGNWEESLGRYRIARREFERTGDLANLAGVETVIAENLGLLGYEDEVWPEMLAAANLSARYAPPQRRYLVLSQCARLAIEQHYYGVARYFVEGAAAVAPVTADPTVECDSLLLRAEADRLVGNAGGAVRAVATAESLAGAVRSSGVRNRILCRIAMARGAALTHTDPGAALGALSSAEKFAADAELRAFDPEIHLLESDAYRELHRSGDELTALRDGMRVYRELAPDNDVDRATFARVGRQIADRIVTATLDRDEPSAWTAVCEARDYRPAHMREISGGEVLIVDYVLDDELLIWIVRDGKRTLVRHRISSATLRTLVDALLEATRAADSLGALRAPSERVYDEVIRPAKPYLTGATQISIMTDSIVDDVPFPVLFDRDTGKRLVEEVELAVVPPVAPGPVLLRQPARVDHDSLFVVAAPEVGSLPRLDGARDEGRMVAALWPGADVRIGRDATPGTFIEGALTHALVHFAGHITEHLDPAQASLRLTPEEGSDGRVTGAQLQRLRRHPPTVVVLAACNASSGRRSAQGRLSVARALFAADVPIVVASLWDVDDGATPVLMADFYAALRRGASPVSALREAQQKAINSNTPPRNWAVFEAYVNQRSF